VAHADILLTFNARHVAPLVGEDLVIILPS